MIKEALKYIVDLSTPSIVEVGGQTYTDKTLERVKHNPKAQAIEMNTLTSLVDYIKANIDTMAEKMIIHVADATSVRLISMLDDDRERENVVNVIAKLPDFSYGRYYSNEEFVIALQSKFVAGDDRDLLLKFAGTVKNGTVAEYGDDGVTQKATIKKGVVGCEDAVIPNPVELRPYRTFLEVEQPASKFIFRMKDDDNGGVKCALFEADGGAWRNAAMKAVKEYLQFELSEFPQFTVIS